MPLFEAERHEPLVDVEWNERRARSALEAIVSDAHRDFRSVDELWPIHALDVSDERPAVLTPLYYGAAGVVWALERLKAVGAATFERDHRPAVRTLLERNRSDALRLTGRPAHGYALGEAGILLLHWTLEPSEGLADQLHAAIEANRDDATLGFTWGSPGAMRASLFMFERTGEARWREQFISLADELWSKWIYDEALGCHLWIHDLYGYREKQLGALHGFAGNVFVLLKGAELLENRRTELIDRAAKALQATVLQEGPFANWPLIAGPTAHPGSTSLRVQHCTGAPGMINAMSGLPSTPEIDALLLAAGELTWAAGPIAKLPGLCHGVPGSGYAFLKLYERTGEECWLGRARRYAMHAIEQGVRGVGQHGQRKYSVWTGDLGLALYLWDCVRGAGEFPMMDVF